MRIPLTGLVLGSLLALAALTIAVIELALVTRFDIAVNEGVHGMTAGWLDDPVSAISALGGSEAVALLTLTAVVGLAALRHWRGAAALALAAVATQLTVTAGKALVERPRPAVDTTIAEAGWSFPSGHAARSFALYVMLAIVAIAIWRRTVPPVLIAGAAATVVVLVGLSRVYLGVHYPTDVVAGWLVGAIVVAVSWAACARLAPRSPHSADQTTSSAAELDPGGIATDLRR